MNLELSFILQDTAENFENLLTNYPAIQVKLGELEYEVAIHEVENNTGFNNFYRGVEDFARVYRVYSPRKFKITGYGVNQKQKEIDAAKALVNSTKEAHKEAQRKLSELVEGE